MTSRMVEALALLKEGPRFSLHNSTATALRRLGYVEWSREVGWRITEAGQRADTS